MRTSGLRSAGVALAAAVLLGACRSDAGRVALADVVLDEVVAVGVVEGAAEQEFGDIVEVRASDDGSFFVLDGQAATVAWFDSAGGFVGGIRSRGAGPGELVRPLAMAVAEADQLAVLDPANARLSIYRMAAPALTYEQGVRGPWSNLAGGRNICGVAGRWYVRNPRDGFLIHEIDRAGEIVRSFEAADTVSTDEFGGFTPIVAPQKNAGSILCLPDRSMIVSLGVHSSRVRAFTLDGELVWESEPVDIRPIQFVVTPAGALRGEVDPDKGAHIGRSVSRWTPETVLVQYVRRLDEPVPEDRDFHGIESLELAIGSGEEVGRSDRLPLVADTKGRLVYSYENLPYPRARVLRRRR